MESIMSDMEKLINAFSDIGIGYSSGKNPFIPEEVVVYVADDSNCVFAKFFFKKDDGKFLRVFGGEA